ncbi:MAG: carbohydrate kinase [Clostridiales bacterium]|nr:carbohydrate kinase [Clostridiales bacterium]
MLFMGIDVGTQGVRCVVSDAAGEIRAAKSIPFANINIAATAGWYEQSPADWQAAAEGTIRDCIAQLKLAGLSADRIRAISIDGTSGTIVPLGRDNRPLTNGIMYNDPRAGEQAARVHAAMGAHEKKLGLKFGASFSLPRILWVHDCMPEVYENTRVFAHQADYVAGLLCGEYAVSDFSNALKTGYDLLDKRWPDEIAALGIDLEKLPKIVQPGAPVANVTKEAAERLGLSESTVVVGGSTDGYASALAAGAVRAGNWASIIGTTFVLKGVTETLAIDPNGSSYSHMLPSGEWMLGGASNIGGRCLNACAAGRSFDELNKASEGLIPTGVRCYPLTGKGERFPFVKPDCLPFYVGDIFGGKLYPALMEGVGFAEKLAFDRMIAIGCPVGDVIYTTGGACRSDLWLKIRASILNRQLKVPAVVDAAMGSALLAASRDMGSLHLAAEKMIRYSKTVDPDPILIAPYADIYAKFVEDVRKNYGEL